MKSRTSAPIESGVPPVNGEALPLQTSQLPPLLWRTFASVLVLRNRAVAPIRILPVVLMPALVPG